MADTISLKLTGAAQGLILGDNSETTLERANTIEVLSLTQPLRSAFERGTGMATGRRYYEPIKFTKLIDRSSPLLRKALVNNESLTGAFKWFRDNNGTTQQFFTIDVSDARLVGATTRLPDTLNPASANLLPMEEIEMVFNTITWTFVPGGVTSTDAWEAVR